MRKTVLIATALLAALALSVGAFALPAVVGQHPTAAAHTSTPTTVTHPKGDDNSTGNQTNENETAPPAPRGNETENETGENETAPPPEANETGNESENGSAMEAMVEHNVTVAESGNTTWVNGTIIVVQGNTTLADVSFQLVVYGNGTANMTINSTQVVGTLTVTVHGMAVFDATRQEGFVAGAVRATQSGMVQWDRLFGFQLSPSGSCGY